MSDLISREALINKLKKHKDYNNIFQIKYIIFKVEDGGIKNERNIV